MHLFSGFKNSVKTCLYCNTSIYLYCSLFCWNYVWITGTAFGCCWCFRTVKHSLLDPHEKFVCFVCLKYGCWVLWTSTWLRLQFWGVLNSIGVVYMVTCSLKTLSFPFYLPEGTWIESSWIWMLIGFAFWNWKSIDNFSMDKSIEMELFT